MTCNNNILVIEDEPSVLETYRAIFAAAVQARMQDVHGPVREGHMVPAYEVTYADSGEAGLEEVARALTSNRPFAVAFVDMRLPGIDGIETVRRIWTLDAQVKIVIVTGFNQYPPSEIIRITRREDVFYLRKPFNAEEIHQFARALIHQWNLERDKDLLTQQLRALRDSEIKIAADMQDTLLFGPVPKAIEGLSIARLTLASQDVDGDFVNFFQPNAFCLDLVMGDVMGKGVPAALLGVVTINRFFQAFYDLSVIETPGQQPEPKRVVAFVRDHMTEQLEVVQAFITLCYVRFDLRRRRAQYVSCGHTPCVQVDSSNKVINWLQGENMPLGFPDPVPIVQYETAFNTEDLFFFYSDGVTEARNVMGDLFGVQRLQALIEANAKRDPQAIISTVHESILAFSESRAIRDDVTCIALRVTA